MNVKFKSLFKFILIINFLANHKINSSPPGAYKWKFQAWSYSNKNIFHRNHAKPESQQNIFDFIVVGAGVAGSVVASRLASSGQYSVLLISEGGISSPLLNIPALVDNYTAPFVKAYKSVPQRNAFRSKNGIMEYLIGTSLGGGSAINGMFSNRGSNHDYDQWARLSGDPSWNYSNILRHFRKYENYLGPNPTNQRGFLGPIPISRPSYAPSLSTWFESGKELGYSINDPNGPQKDGFAWLDYTMRNGRRMNSYDGYIKPLLKRNVNNLVVLANTTVTRIMFKGNEAVGVKFRRSSGNESEISGEATARKEIIVTAGVMDSPALLMRSGIGPKSVLEKAKVQIVKDLPVGKNLLDHIGVIHKVIFQKGTDVFDPIRDLTPDNWQLYEKTGDGPYSSNFGSSGQAFLSSSVQSPFEKSLRWPDLHLVPCHIAQSENVSLTHPKRASDIVVNWAGMIMRPKSVGSVTLDAKNVDGPPVIDPAYFTHPDDMKKMLEVTKLLIKICEETQAFRRINCEFYAKPLKACEHLGFRTDAYWECYISHETVTGYHAGGTCKMGRGPEDTEAVVDSSLTVIGITGLRVADASIMPIITNSNVMAAIYAIGEKAADMILARWNWPLLSI